MKKEKENKMSITESFEAIDKIIAQMDDEKCSLEKGMELYEKGKKLIAELSKKIDKIDKDIKVVKK